jgi:Ser/Thr protein kinase RdoA (MazF antagonist)
MNTNVGHSQNTPVQRSIVSADALALLVAQAYGLDSVGCQLIKSAMLDTYHVTAASGTAILRIYPARRPTQVEIKAELDELAYLHAGGVAVSVPIRQPTSEQLLALQAPEGTRYVALFTDVPGPPLA